MGSTTGEEKWNSPLYADLKKHHRKYTPEETSQKLLRKSFLNIQGVKEYCSHEPCLRKLLENKLVSQKTIRETTAKN